MSKVRLLDISSQDSILGSDLFIPRRRTFLTSGMASYRLDGLETYLSNSLCITCHTV